ncbi:Uncharacterised protein [Leminorella richardii]|uniref:Uncharacterized protein n=1 Tax=Leminorella richardii TaxID=158841 RepID=A0A2X4UB00_9GAMM|nr:Uncharacterised protein [Leminorella richardii]
MIVLIKESAFPHSIVILRGGKIANFILICYL